MLCLLLFALLAGDEIDDWIARLGDADLASRDAAAEKLIAAGRKAAPKVRKLLESDDPELKSRARDILARMTPEYEKAYEFEARERCEFSPDGRFLSWWDDEGCLQVSWARTGQGRRAYEGPAGGRRWDQRFNRGVPAWTGTRVLADLGGGTLQSIDPEKPASAAKLSDLKKRLEAFTPLASGDALIQDGAELKIYVAKNSKAYALPVASAGVISADASRIIGMDSNGTFTLHAGVGSWKTREMVRGGHPARWIVATPDLSRIYIAAPATLAEVNSANLTVKPLAELKGDEALRCITMRSDGAWLLTGHAGKRVDIQLADTLRTIAKFDLPGPPDHVAVTADGSMVAVVVDTTTIVYRRKD
jgi:hypothetical protein